MFGCRSRGSGSGAGSGWSCGCGGCGSILGRGGRPFFGSWRIFGCLDGSDFVLEGLDVCIWGFFASVEVYRRARGTMVFLSEYRGRKLVGWELLLLISFSIGSLHTRY